MGNELYYLEQASVGEELYMVKKGSERDLIRTDKPTLGAKNS